MENQFPHLAFTPMKPPTYLKQLWSTDDNILLIHRKKNSLHSTNSDLEGDELDDIESPLELTGCPLNVDLHEDTYTSLIIERPNNWIATESKHFPLKLEEARTVLNTLNSGKLTLASDQMKSLPIFCICDGNNKKNIIVLGVICSNGLFKRIQVSFNGYFPEDNTALSLATLKDKHKLKLTSSEWKITTTTRSVYELYGFDMRNVEKYPEIGCIHIEVVNFLTPSFRPSVKMLLQSVVGHSSSVLYGLWQQILFVENCVNLLKTPMKLECAQIGLNVKDFNVLMDELYSALRESTIHRSIPKNTQQLNLNAAINKLTDLKTIYATDRIWDILKDCGTVQDLQLYLELIIQSVAFDNSVRVCVSDEDSSILGKIITGITNKTIVLPNLSNIQTIEILIDLALVKLFRDYSCLITYFGFVENEKLINKWNELEDEKIKTNRSEYVRSTFRENPLLSSLHNINANSKLSYLKKLHTVLEFVNLVEQHDSGVVYSEIINQVAVEAYSKFMNNEITKSLLELNVSLRSCDTKVVENLDPITWQIEMKSSEKSSETCTVFCKARNPIFPDCISKAVAEKESDLTSSFTGSKFYLYQLDCYSNNV